MKRFELSRPLLGRTITVHALRLEQGVQVSVSGGELPHIGAVSMVSPEGELTSRQFPGHKDGVVSDRWVKALAETGCRPAVVTAGIHYDNLSREGIGEVLALTDELLSGLLRWLRQKDG